MRKHLKVSLLLGPFLSLLFLNTSISQVGLTNSGMTQEQERNQASKGFDYGNKSGSALQQLENMTGQKVNSSNYNSPRYNQTTVSKPTLSFDQQMNVMVTGMIAQSIISSMFSSNNTVPRVQEAKTQPATLMMNSYAENQKIQNTLILSKHQKMMDLYKILKDENGMKYKSITDLSMNLKPYLTQEEIERQKIINKGISVTWDYNSWAQVSPNTKKIDDASLNYQRTNADNYLDEAINKIETFPGGTGRIAAVAGRFMVNIKDESMSYLNDAKDAVVSGNVSKMEDLGQQDLRKITSNALYNTGVQTAKSYVEQGKDKLFDNVNEMKNEVNIGIMKESGFKLLDEYKIYAPIADDWKVSLKKY